MEYPAPPGTCGPLGFPWRIPWGSPGYIWGFPRMPGNCRGCPGTPQGCPGIPGDAQGHPQGMPGLGGSYKALMPIARAFPGHAHPWGIPRDPQGIPGDPHATHPQRSLGHTRGSLAIPVDPCDPRNPRGSSATSGHPRDSQGISKCPHR